MKRCHLRRYARRSFVQRILNTSPQSLAQALHPKPFDQIRLLRIE